MSAKKSKLDSPGAVLSASFLCSLFVVGVTWGGLLERVDALDAKVTTYESANQQILEELRLRNNKIEVSLAKLENDVSWIKEEMSHDK
jgi:hypothetical protein